MMVEVCANSVQSALNAQEAGADRLEICSELAVGGITPSYGLLGEIKKRISIPVHVLIRPRSGDFTYSDIEFETILSDIANCVKMGFEGIVCGVLNSDFTLDWERTSELREATSEVPFTFHRAFDWVRDPLRTLEQLESIGVDNVLTSGQSKTAIEGITLLEELSAKSKRSTVIPAAGINPENALMFKHLGFSVIHLSGARLTTTLAELPKTPMNSPGLLSEDKVATTDPDLISQLIKQLNNCE